MKDQTLYRKLQSALKSQILSGIYKDGDFLPSEHELMSIHTVTRSTVRQALDELVKEGYIIKIQGKGSRVQKRSRRTLGLLSIKGFSEAAGDAQLEINTIMIDKPRIKAWDMPFFHTLSEMEEKAGCIYLKRLRCVAGEPVMHETTFISNLNLPRFCSRPFIHGSLFETLNGNYQVEITDVDQDLRVVTAPEDVARLLEINPSVPLLHIFLRFHTNREHLFLYSSLYCNTEKYSIGNRL